MRRLILLVVLLLSPTLVDAKVIKWEGKPVSVFISTERLTRIEFPENLRSVFLSRSDIALEKEERSLYVRALAPDVGDTIFVVGESGTTYEINLSTLIILEAVQLRRVFKQDAALTVLGQALQAARQIIASTWPC
jgi:hypothetical protein